MEAVAKLNNYPTSPRKMRLLADLIRGMEVDKALGVLQFNPKHPAVPLYKLLKSAINNWEQKNTDAKVEDANLVVKTIMVDGGRVIRRMRPAPQGRGYRIRKRSNHVTLVVDSKVIKAVKEKVVLDRKAEPVEAVAAPGVKKTRTRTKKESTTTQTETK
jgi:large subunit ribosomal protein L22